MTADWSNWSCREASCPQYGAANRAVLAAREAVAADVRAMVSGGPILERDQVATAEWYREWGELHAEFAEADAARADALAARDGEADHYALSGLLAQALVESDQDADLRLWLPSQGDEQAQDAGTGTEATGEAQGRTEPNGITA